jgi:hypothetical protein
MTDLEKEMIAVSLETDEGRIALSQALIEPLRRILGDITPYPYTVVFYDYEELD